mmetsp:Transcript_22947/g.35911  ORF Transcript_22947/g.35911 Transcript_22947/m.35911 type:complete len:196 (+) Transcript_22947:514-1101(+)
MSRHSSWVLSATLGSSVVVGLIGFDRFLPGMPGGILASEENTHRIEALERTLVAATSRIKELTQQNEQFAWTQGVLKAVLQVVAFGGVVLYNSFKSEGMRGLKATLNTFTGRLPSVVEVPEYSAAGQGPAGGELMDEKSKEDIHQMRLKMVEVEATASARIALIETKTDALRRDMLAELRKVRELAGIQLSRATA